MFTTSPSPRTRAAALIVGALLSAAGHMLHPLDHTAADRAVDRFQMVHVLFLVGSMLVLAGLPLVRRRLGGDATAAVLVGSFIASTMLIAPLVSIEMFASEHVDQATFDRIVDESAAIGAVAMITMVVGAIGVGVLLYRRRVSRLLGAVMAASGVMLLLIPGLPGKEGYWAIASLTAMNVALALVGAQSLGRRAGREAGHHALTSATAAAPSSSAMTIAS